MDSSESMAVPLIFHFNKYNSHILQICEASL